MATTSSIFAAKTVLRKQLKSSLSSMRPEERHKQSEEVTDLVMQSPEFKASKRVCLYLSMDEEVDTSRLLKHIFDTGRQCFVPRYTKDTMEMLELFSMQDYENLPLTKWKIKQPEPANSTTDKIRKEALASGGLDLIILPGLGFSIDKTTGQWHRLGRGKGYYDAYLEKCSQTENPPATIALAFREQIVESIPVTENDKPIQKVYYSHNYLLC